MPISGRHGVLAAMALLCAHCGQDRAAPPAPDPALTDRELRAFEGGLVTVTSFSPGEGHPYLLENGQHYRYWLYVQPFTAALRVARKATVETVEQLRAHTKEPGWTIEDAERGTQRLTVLGAGEAREGDVREVSAFAFFERVGADWRFVGFQDRSTF